jgi:hypothetical protein
MLATASLLGILTILFGVIGPWIWFWPAVILAPITGFLSYLVYRLSLAAAVALSRALRAGCDLYRRDLLHALGCEVADTLEGERNAWTTLSQLVIYGDAPGLTFRTAPEISASGISQA